MKSAETIFNSTNVNRYGMAFRASALFSAIEQSWQLGLPSFIGHDHHRLLGWCRPIALFIQPGLGLLAGEVLFPESDKEAEPLKNNYWGTAHRRIEKYVYPYREEIGNKLKGLLDGKESWEYAEGAAVMAKDLGRKRFPNIFSKQDDDGLIPLSELKTIRPGIFDAGDGLVLFAHPFLRRSLSRLNTLNEPFLSKFQTACGESAGKFEGKIALDPDLIGLAHTVKETIELEYWWGPKFDTELGNIDPGVTHHEASERAKFFHGISATDFGWYDQKGYRTFECEELRDLETLGAGGGKFGCRFVHSILHPETKIPFHLDGAIRMYNEMAMLTRIETGFKEAGRKTEYTKLWRVDGEISVPLWKELISHYYRDNHLVGEYFGGVENAEETALENVQIAEPPEIRNLVPCDFSPDDGLRVSISLHGKTDGKNEVEIVSLDSLSTANERVPYVEADAVELLKVMKRHGLNVQLPEGLHRMAFEDLVLNFPLLVFRGANKFKNAGIVLDCIRELCNAWVSDGLDKLISFSLDIEFEEYKFCVSWAGHVSAFKKFFDAGKLLSPHTTADVRPWIDDTLKSLTEMFPKTKEEPTIWRLLENSGIITLSRRILKPTEFKLGKDFNEVLIARNLHGPMKQFGLRPTKICDIIESTCTNGHPDYMSCDCIKTLDGGVGQIITKGELFGLFITNRSAW